MKILFLDFDGVIRVPLDDPGIGRTEPDFCQARMRMLHEVCRLTGARIVVSSDWRTYGNRDVIAGHLSPWLEDHLHPDWLTPVCGQRWIEIDRWLAEHPEVTRYAILNDVAILFDGCPPDMHRRLILCTNRYGLVPQLAHRAHELLQS